MTSETPTGECPQDKPEPCACECRANQTFRLVDNSGRMLAALVREGDELLRGR